MTIVLGAQYHLGSPEAVRRQRQSLDAIAGLSGVEPINVQWVEDAYAPDGLETVAVLKRDSVGVSGMAGRRRPHPYGSARRPCHYRRGATASVSFRILQRRHYRHSIGD